MGNGSRFAMLALASLVASTPAFAVGVVPQDDGGSGGDAPDLPASTVPLVAGETVRGTILARYEEAVPTPTNVRDVDTYAFQAAAGQTAKVTLTGPETCVRIVDATGAPLAGDPYFNQDGAICSLALFSGATAADAATIPADGEYYAMVQTARGAGSSAYTLTLVLE